MSNVQTIRGWGVSVLVSCIMALALIALAPPFHATVNAGVDCDWSGTVTSYDSEGGQVFQGSWFEGGLAPSFTACREMRRCQSYTKAAGACGYPGAVSVTVDWTFVVGQSWEHRVNTYACDSVPSC
jgi:hypothetical protein